MRKQFTFYESFASSIQRIRKAADRCTAYDAIVRYALYEEEPDLEHMPDAAAIVFDLIKPTLDSSKRKAESGQKGGKAEANDKQTGSEGNGEANDKQTESKPEANAKQTASEKEGEDEKEGEIEKENECYKPPLTPREANDLGKAVTDALQGRSIILRGAVADWVQYKAEKRQKYKPTGLQSLLTQIRKAAEQYGDNEVAEVIHRSMSANYQGIVFDWLKKDQPKQKPKQYTTQENYKAPTKKLTVDELYGLLDKI